MLSSEFAKFARHFTRGYAARAKQQRLARLRYREACVSRRSDCRARRARALVARVGTRQGETREMIGEEEDGKHATWRRPRAVLASIASSARAAAWHSCSLSIAVRARGAECGCWCTIRAVRRTRAARVRRGACCRQARRCGHRGHQNRRKRPLSALPSPCLWAELSRAGARQGRAWRGGAGRGSSLSLGCTEAPWWRCDSLPGRCDSHIARSIDVRGHI